ncbi:MAG: hypothetical protein ACSHYB_19490 [Roseibacillus sp.]
MKKALLISLVAARGVLGVPATLVLDEGAGQNAILFASDINSIVFDSQTTTYTGTIEVALEIVSGEVSAFEMTGGVVSASDVSFFFELFPGTAQTVDFIGATAIPISPLGEEVLVSAGTFSAPQHVFRFDDGCIEADGAFGYSKNQISEDPFDAAGVDVGSISLGSAVALDSTITNLPIVEQYPVCFSLNLDSTAIQTEGEITVTTVTTGTVTAQGFVLDYLHPFYEWAAANAPEAGLGLAFDADADGDGVADGISWALGYAAGASEQVPIPVWDAVGEAMVFPLSGTTRHPVTLEASADLSPTGWLPVSGFDPIPQGWTGDVVVPKASVGRRFFRFVSSLP